MENLVFKVYIHGRPQGQSFYPNQGLSKLDSLYLRLFLDSPMGSDVEDALLTDIVGNSVYYTYIRRQNVFEKGRGQGYFAITIRFDGVVCSYVSELYRYLKEIYTKYSKTIIETKDGSQSFLIEDFDEKTNDVERIVSTVNKLISEAFSPYLEALVSSGCDTRQKEVRKYSSKDVDCVLFREDMENYRLIISYDYPSLLATNNSNSTYSNNSNSTNLSSSVQKKEIKNTNNDKKHNREQSFEKDNKPRNGEQQTSPPISETPPPKKKVEFYLLIAILVFVIIFGVTNSPSSNDFTTKKLDSCKTANETLQKKLDSCITEKDTVIIQLQKKLDSCMTAKDSVIAELQKEHKKQPSSNGDTEKNDLINTLLLVFILIISCFALYTTCQARKANHIQPTGTEQTKNRCNGKK